MPTILLTRPRAQSESLALLFERLGYTCVIEPLLIIVPLKVRPPKFDAFDSVMITSGNTLDALMPHKGKIKSLLKLPCYCVGARTAEKAQAFGFQNVRHSDSDGKALADLMLRDSTTTNPLHISARDAMSAGRDALTAAGVNLHVWGVYEAAPIEALSRQTLEHLEARTINAVLVYSPRTAHNLKVLLERHKISDACSSVIAVGLSAAVGVELALLPWKNLLVAPDPSEAQMIECLKRVCPVR